MKIKLKIWLGLFFAGIALVLMIVFSLWLISDSGTDFQRQPSSRHVNLDPANFIHNETLRLLNFEKGHFFLISNTDSFSQLAIFNEVQDSAVDLDLELSCDRDFHLGLSSISSNISSRNLNNKKERSEAKEIEDIKELNGGLKSYKFTLKNRDKALFVFSKNIKKCNLIYGATGSPGRVSSIELRSESLDFAWLTKLIHHQEICESPAPIFTGQSESIFEELSHPQLSCIHTAKELELLETPESGFLAKTEMLLGQKLDSSFIANQNPYADIDFSQAPGLDAIFVATLVYRADFYGTVLARLLKYHADRGTVVHLMTTGYMMLEKDRQLLFKLAAQNGHFRIQPFKYNDPNYDLTRPGRFIDSKFRDMHIKLFITLSKNEKNNAVVLGGRNVHDGFLFKNKPDSSKYPDLVQYGVEEDFVHWNDFEMKITSKDVAEATAAHLLNFWNRDTMTQARTDFSKASGSQSEGPAKERIETSHSMASNEFRHFISVPYSDGHALEDLYISLINSAKKRIRISSPYLRPTTKIMQAIQKAAERKVEITIQTRVSLQGDTEAWLYEEVNKESINDLFEKVRIFEWMENSILHSKFILIDDDIGFIGSVNLSRRSFVQDVENGFVVRSPFFIKQMDGIFNSCLAKSKKITERKERKIIPSLFIQILKNQF